MRIDAGLTAALLCLAAPAAVTAQASDARMAKAVVARDAGRTQEAIALLETLSRERPDDLVPPGLGKPCDPGRLNQIVTILSLPR